MEIIKFQPEMIADAAKILATRHQTERRTFPELPVRFEQAEYAERAIQDLFEKASYLGVAAFYNGKLIGFMIANLLNEPQRGRHAWIDYAGYAIDRDQSVELIRQLYSQLGEQLIRIGYFSHFVLSPCADDKAVDAWFRLCFAHEQVHGLLSLENIEPPPSADPSIRLAAKADEAAVRSMSNMIPSQVAAAPAWGATLPEMLPALNDGFAELLDEKDVRFWASFDNDGSIASCLATWPDPESEADMKIPERCSTISCVATQEVHRGKGLSSQLLAIALYAAKQDGYQFFETDWRMANLPISNFLPGRGFKPYAYRLHRRIDERILWADGVNTSS